jgi:uncharacterized protein (DUF924 family)
MKYDGILDFWFRECKPRQWFRTDAALDQTIRERFTETYWRVAGNEVAHWRETPEGRLAEIIVLDQFARNIFRGTPQAFAEDDRALALAEEAVEQGADRKLSATMRHFLYMPFMHSESVDAHKKAVRLFLSLPPWKWVVVVYELRHKRTIERFGRYPARNAVLGRQSTAAELKYLKAHSSG